MSEMTVKKFSEAIGTPADRLLKQMLEAGIKGKKEDSPISNEEKQQLLSFLKGRHSNTEGNSPQKVVLRRKSTMELTQKSPQNTARRGTPVSRTAPTASKVVNVEVRKRRTYVKRSDVQSTNEDTVTPPQAQVTEPTTTNTPVTEKVTPPIISETATNIPEETQTTPVTEEIQVPEIPEATPAPEKIIPTPIEVVKAVKTPTSIDKAPPAKTEAIAPSAKKNTHKTPEPPVAPVKKTTENTDKPKPPSGKPKHNERPNKKNILAKKEKAPKNKKSTIKAADVARRQRIKNRIVSRPSKTHEFQKPTKTIIREIILPEAIAVSELAQRMAVKGTEIIKVLMGMGSMVTMNQVLDRDTAALVVEELGHTYTLLDEDVSSAALLEDDIKHEALPRPPVVTIMGHVDHGKTSLLDYIRKSNVTAKESGGITQHIGAYHVELEQGIISFLDTPGHAAFTAMRARGANVTDIVIIVVAADDGVMPQTVEAIQHAKAAGAPIIIAVNKMDRQEANPDKVKQELGMHEIIPEDWGGDTIFVEVSAKTGLGIDNLLDAILLQAEILELKAPREGRAFGTVVESRMDKGLGSVITVLVQGGVLHQGDILLIGEYYGRVRALRDEQGVRVKEAGPSIPIEVLGISGLPNSGDEATVVNNERKAREIALVRQNKTREIALSKRKGTRLEDIFNQAVAEGDLSHVNLIIKADTQGSVEALSDSLVKLSNDEVRVNVVISGVGGINESDITLAVASQAMMIGFNVRTDSNARRVAKQMEVEPRYYSVIYDVIDDIKDAIISKLKPEIKEEITGIAEVRDVFRSSKLGAIAGCLVIEGAIKRGNPIRVLRNHVVVYEGELESLRRFKDDANEVKAGIECGIGVKNYNDIKAKDQIEVFIRIETKRTL